MAVNRRDFVQQRHGCCNCISHAAGIIGQQLSRSELPVIPDVTWNKAPCRSVALVAMCRWQLRTTVLVAIAGDRQAEVNKGLLCVKGYHVGSILYGKDRLTTPQLRKNGKLEPISWEEAIEVISQRIMKGAKPLCLLWLRPMDSS